MITAIPAGFTELHRLPGKITADGIYATLETNWVCHAKDPSNNPCALIYCHPGTYTIVDMDRVVDISQAGVWSIMSNGYPGIHTYNAKGKRTMMSLHEFLFSNTENPKRIEHINKDPLDNRLQNLRLITRTQQNFHRPKCSRRKDARPLPEGLTQFDLPKYIVYVEDIQRKKLAGGGIQEIHRAYFRITDHPLQVEKKKGVAKMFRPEYRDFRICYTSTRSKFKNAREKLAEARIYLVQLERIAEDTGFIVPGSIEDKDPK